MFKSFISTRSLAVSIALGAAALAVAPKAHAAEINAAVGTQQAVGQHTGIVWGNTSSESKGSVAAAASLIGAGAAEQMGHSNTLGSSTFGGKIDSIGTTVFSGSSQDTTVKIGGTYSGNVQLQEGNTILTGSQAYGSTVGQAKVDSNFEVKQYGSVHHDAIQIIVGF